MKKVFLGFVALVGAFALMTAGIAFADHSPPDGPAVTPTLIGGNPSCVGGLKIEPVVSGTYAADFGGFAGTITITVTGSTFTFVTDSEGHLVTSVIVKGGPDANSYNYVNWDGAGAEGIAHDDGLHSPNRTPTRFYGLSHLCFFTDKK